MDPISLISQIDPSVKATLPGQRPVSQAKPAAEHEVKAPPSEDQLSQVASMVENSLADRQLRLHFAMGENKRIIIQLIDEKKGEVVRTIPPDQLNKFMLNAAKGEGMLVDFSG